MAKSQAICLLNFRCNARGEGCKYLSVIMSCNLTRVSNGISPELFNTLKYLSVGSYPHSS